MSEVQVFATPLAGVEIEAVEINGESLLSVPSLARALEYSNTHKAMRHLPAKHIRKIPKRALGRSEGGHDVPFTTEAGLYRLILRSTMPKAEEFTDWVTEELLPTVRKAQEAGIDSVKVLKDQIEDLKSEVEMSESEARVMRNTVNKEASTAYRLGYFAGRRASRYDSQAMDPYRGKLFSKPPKNLEYLYALGVARRG